MRKHYANTLVTLNLHTCFFEVLGMLYILFGFVRTEILQIIQSTFSLQKIWLFSAISLRFRVASFYLQLTEEPDVFFKQSRMLQYSFPMDFSFLKKSEREVCLYINLLQHNRSIQDLPSSKLAAWLHGLPSRVVSLTGHRRALQTSLHCLWSKYRSTVLAKVIYSL